LSVIQLCRSCFRNMYRRNQVAAGLNRGSINRRKYINFDLRTGLQIRNDVFMKIIYFRSANLDSFGCECGT
jgi:hypothetical protein